jgi:hypothetical protein
MIRAALLTAAALAACLFAQRADAQPPSPWAPVEGGWRALVSLPSAPYPDGRAPYRDDRVWIFVPKGFRGESCAPSSTSTATSRASRPWSPPSSSKPSSSPRAATPS